jgi:hypothetical protein
MKPVVGNTNRKYSLNFIDVTVQRKARVVSQLLAVL